MTTHRRLVLAGAGAPLLLTSAAPADFVGLQIAKKPIEGFEAFVSLVANIYAVFSDDNGDGIGDGAVIGVGGLPGMEGNITVCDGVFYQNPLNTSNVGRTAPPQAFAELFPSLLVDTFVTIGLKVVPTGVADNTGLTPTFPLEGGGNKYGSWSDTRLELLDGAWFSFDPDSPQARPGNGDNPNGAVLIGQFSIAAGFPQGGVVGTLLVQGFDGDGSTFQEYLSFDNDSCGFPPAPGTGALLGVAGLLSPRRRRR